MRSGGGGSTNHVIYQTENSYELRSVTLVFRAEDAIFFGAEFEKVPKKSSSVFVISPKVRGTRTKLSIASGLTPFAG